MEKQGCLNVTLDDQKYSSPMPMIGLYIAASTFVCVLFMVCDVFLGLRRRKPWIPCKLFSLNSLTLSLLAIASKLPIDLTTPMPSVHDQLSKLSGTVLICVSICVLFPSLGSQSDSERLSNMLSLTIFVITVVVNICMQLVTGVIYLFIVEHIIIMACMLLLLTALWSTFDAVLPLRRNIVSFNLVGELRDPKNSETQSMIQKLKSFFVSSCVQNPELDLFMSLVCLIVCMISTLSALVLSQAALRSLVLKKVEFRCGVSDYKWSMWIVVVTQIVTILVGSIASIFRWLLIFNEDNNEGMNVYKVLSTLSKLHIFPTWVLSTLSKLQIISFFQISRRIFVITFHTISRNVLMVFFWVQLSMMLVSSFLYLLMLKIPLMCGKKIRKICFGEQRNGDNRDYMYMHQWIQRNCEEDMNKWMEKYRSNSPTDHLIQLLSRTPKSENPFTNQIQYKLSCLFVVIFIRIAIHALPNALSASLVRTLDEAFGIIYFIDKKMNTTDEDKNKRAIAKELWMNRNNTCHWFHTVLVTGYASGDLRQLESYCSLRACLLWPYKQFKERRLAYDIIDGEVENIKKIIVKQESRRDESSIELYVRMEQLFVDMLHFFLSQFPLAIFKHLVESPIVEHEERARFVLKILCKLEPLEYKVDWSFPDGSGITTLITPQVPSTHTQVHHSLADGSSVTQHIELVEGNADADVARQVINDDEIQELV